MVSTTPSRRPEVKLYWWFFRAPEHLGRGRVDMMEEMATIRDLEGLIPPP